MEIIGTLEVECDGFTFISGFDSSNLAGVEGVCQEFIPSGYHVPGRSSKDEIPDFEFNVWSRRDCEGTSYECFYKMWYYFGVKSDVASGKMVQFNIMGAQARMYSEGMSPVYLVLPGNQEWQRIKSRVVYFSDENSHGISFKYRMPTKERATTYFAFTYPFPFEQLQSYLTYTEKHMMHHKDIYFHREILCHTLEGRPVELITVSSFRNITRIREPRLKDLFPEKDKPRAFTFRNKKVIFVSARVHPGETPSSFVLKGFMDYLLTSFDPRGTNLRNNFVFKIIPMLNPDGVAKGNFRTDTRGMDLNRVYNEPSMYHHPAIYAARSLILYYHTGREIEGIANMLEAPKKKASSLQGSMSSENLAAETEGISEENKASDKRVKNVSNVLKESKTVSYRNQLECGDTPNNSRHSLFPRASTTVTSKGSHTNTRNNQLQSQSGEENSNKDAEIYTSLRPTTPRNSGLFMYVDLHGHSTRKGVFMFGNHFKDPNDLVECMLFPKIMSLNSETFDFSNCSFSERNMTLKDKSSDLSKEGCGRVMVMKLTGIVRSYTLECNYNTGRIVNELPPRAVVDTRPDVLLPQRKVPLVPYQYTPETFEEVGKAMAISLTDLKCCNPWSRVPYSEYHSLDGIRRWLKNQIVPEQEALNKRNSKIIKRNH